MRTIDLNADLGEGFGRWSLGDDDALLTLVTSANVACGFHAGDPTVMRRVCRGAARRGVRIGAQVGYRDLAGFGRRFIDVDPADLTAEVMYQLAALQGFAAAAGSRVSYLKPHGALYNAVVHHQEQAGAVVAAITALDPTLPVLGLPGSAVLAAADRAGVPGVTEAFPDRAYTPGGTLLPRDRPGAVLHDADVVAARAVAIATGEPVADADGAPLRLAARSICLHGDTPDAARIAATTRAALFEAGVSLAPFT